MNERYATFKKGGGEGLDSFAFLVRVPLGSEGRKESEIWRTYSDLSTMRKESAAAAAAAAGGRSENRRGMRIANGLCLRCVRGFFSNPLPA